MDSSKKQPYRYVFWPELSRFIPHWAALLIWYGWVPFACAVYLLLRKLGVVRNILEEGLEYWFLFGWPIVALTLHLVDWALWRLTKGRRTRLRP